MNVGLRARRRQVAARNTWRRPQVWLHLIIPLLAILSLIPAYLMLSISVKNPLQYRYDRWSITFPWRLGNYGAAWAIVSTYIWNTIFVAVVGCLGVLVLSVIGGHVFARMRFPFRGPLFYAIIGLLMVPWVLSLIPSYMLYYQFGLINTRWALIIPNIAGGSVFGIFMMSSFIAGIPEELYEAARCDGAGVGTLIGRITLPLSMPGIATLAVLNFIGTWNSFIWPLVVITDKSKQVISVGLFQLANASGGELWGPLFAGYVIASAPLVILFVFLGRFYVEGLMGSGLKV